jgi:hypothetical protein
VFADPPVAPPYWQRAQWAAMDGITITGGRTSNTPPLDVSSTD